MVAIKKQSSNNNYYNLSERITKYKLGINVIVHIYKQSKGFRGTESISNNSAITVTAILCNYNNSNQFAKSLLTLQQIASLIVCQQNTKILYNLPALHTCALNGVDGLEDGLTATKRDDHDL